MKTRREDMALESERVLAKRSQATGFVSSIMVRMEGGVAVTHRKVSYTF
jgi:hypothetical protein